MVQSLVNAHESLSNLSTILFIPTVRMLLEKSGNYTIPCTMNKAKVRSSNPIKLDVFGCIPSYSVSGSPSNWNNNLEALEPTRINHRKTITF